MAGGAHLLAGRRNAEKSRSPCMANPAKQSQFVPGLVARLNGLKGNALRRHYKRDLLCETKPIFRCRAGTGGRPILKKQSHFAERRFDGNCGSGKRL